MSHVGHSISYCFLTCNINNIHIGFIQLLILGLNVHVVLIHNWAWSPKQSISQGGYKLNNHIPFKLIFQCLGHHMAIYSHMSMIEYSFDFVILLEAKAFVAPLQLTHLMSSRFTFSFRVGLHPILVNLFLKWILCSR